MRGNAIDNRSIALQRGLEFDVLMRSRSSAFDVTASTFESYRVLPQGVPEAIRTSIWSVAGLSGPARVLDIGAGTGRVGRAFLDAGDSYVGLDASDAMLREFFTQFPRATLVHADGTNLPFAEDSFDVVLLMQVLSGAEYYCGILDEACRVVRPGGCIVVGQTVSPESGIDTQLKRRLKVILDEMEVKADRPEERRDRGLARLRSHAKQSAHRVAASWTIQVAVEGFFQRHRTGARFAKLPSTVQEQALTRLREWANGCFGSLGAASSETRNFELDIFEF